MSLQQLTPVLATAEPASAFSQQGIEFCQALSNAIFADSRQRHYPDLTALAFWLRNANISRLIEPYRYSPLQHKPLGTVFHNAPANVDSLFVYSGILSLLCGNINIIRLSSRAGGSADILQEKLWQLADSYPQIAARFQLIRCPHGSAELASLLQTVDGRVLWGSDNAISQQRAMPVAAHCRDVIFSHKLSCALLCAESLLQASAAELQQLLERFCRDNLTFAQQACSSAKVIIWQGEANTIAAAKQRFWQALPAVASHDKYALSDSEHYDALAQAQLLAITDQHSQHLTITTPFVRLQLSQLTTEQVNSHTGKGLFLELDIATLSQLSPMLQPQHQTLSHWGFQSQALHDWYQTVLTGSDRLVAIGDALNFSHIWDGQDLIHAFSRVIPKAALS